MPPLFSHISLLLFFHICCVYHYGKLTLGALDASVCRFVLPGVSMEPKGLAPYDLAVR